MITDVFVTKIGMTQAWTKQGKRMAVTRCSVQDAVVVGKRDLQVTPKRAHTRTKVNATIFEVGYGKKKLKNMTKPLRSKLEQSGFSFGARKLQGVRVYTKNVDVAQLPNVGDTINATSLLEVGDVVQVQGVSKGRGFAGAIKRHGFHGGPATHGQSDRARAVGSIGAGTSPGRVWAGQKMPGHYGVETKSVTGLIVVHVDPETNEVWLNGPVPGAPTSYLKISKTGKKKEVELNREASGLPAEVVEEVVTEESPAEESVDAPVEPVESTQEVTEEVKEEVKEEVASE